MANVPTAIITSAEEVPASTTAPYQETGPFDLQGGYWIIDDQLNVNANIDSAFGTDGIYWVVPSESTQTFTGTVTSRYGNIGAITLYLVPGSDNLASGTNTITLFYYDGGSLTLLPIEPTTIATSSYQVATTLTTGQLTITTQPSTISLLVVTITMSRPGRFRVSQSVPNLGGVIQGISFNPCSRLINGEDFSVSAPSSAVSRVLLSTTYGYSALESWSFDATEASPYPRLRLTLQPCGSWPYFDLYPDNLQITKVSNPLSPPFNVPQALLWVGRGYEPGYAYVLASATIYDGEFDVFRVYANCIGQFADPTTVLVIDYSSETSDAAGVYMHSGAVTSVGIVVLTPTNLFFVAVDSTWYTTGVGNAGYATSEAVLWNMPGTPTYTYAASCISPSDATVLIGGVTTSGNTPQILVYTKPPSSFWNTGFPVSLTGVTSPASPQSWAIVSTKNDIWLIATKQRDGLLAPVSFYAYTIPVASGTSLTKIGGTTSSVLRSVLGPVVVLPLVDIVLWLDGDFSTSGAGLVVFSTASSKTLISKRSYTLTWTGVPTAFATYPVFVEQTSTTTASFIVGDVEGNVYRFIINMNQAEGVTSIALTLTTATGIPPPTALDCVRLTTFTGFDGEHWVCRSSSYGAGNIQESFTRYSLAFP